MNLIAPFYVLCLLIIVSHFFSHPEAQIIVSYFRALLKIAPLTWFGSFSSRYYPQEEQSKTGMSRIFYKYKYYMHKHVLTSWQSFDVINFSRFINSYILDSVLCCPRTQKMMKYKKCQIHANFFLRILVSHYTTQVNELWHSLLSGSFDLDVSTLQGFALTSKVSLIVCVRKYMYVYVFTSYQPTYATCHDYYISIRVSEGFRGSMRS